MLSKKNLQKYLQIQVKLSDKGNVVIMSQSGVGGVLMPVLCEAISVVVRRDAIDQYYEGGWAKFLEVVPNTTMCTDGDLVRVGFMSPQYVQEFVDVLESSGLQFLGQKKFMGILGGSRQQNDIIVIDQNQGPTMPCDWIEFGKVRMGDDNTEVSFAWLLREKSPYTTSNSIQIDEDQLQKFVTPDGWSLDNTKTMHFVQPEHLNSRLQFLRTEDEVDVFWDRELKKEVFRPKYN